MRGRPLDGRAGGDPGLRATPRWLRSAALATWITPEDTVEQAAGRTVMLAHGLHDRVTDPARSYALAVQLRDGRADL